MIARVATDLSLNKLFDYLIPASMEPYVRIGSRVKIPFGNRVLAGYVIQIESESSIVPKVERRELLEVSRPVQLKEILDIIGEDTLLTEPVMKLASWIARYYCCPLEAALRCVVPQSVRSEQSGWKKRLFVRYIAGDSADKSKLTERQKRVLRLIQEKGELALAELISEASCTTALVRRLEAAGCVKIAPIEVLRDPYQNLKLVPSIPLKLNFCQSEALKEITSAIDEENCSQIQPFLLFGVTGSGKTEVYLQAISNALERGKGAIVLVPEISLTPQTVERFKSRFAEGALRTQVAVLHSNLSDGERHDEWHKIRRGEARIVIGARSAVFAPVNPLGLIIVDEEHENSYKQEDSPRYNARDVAVVRARLEKTVVVLGSATPCMESYANALSGKYSLLKLPKRVDDISMPRVNLVNMCGEIRYDHGIPHFSSILKEAISLRLEQSQQVILFLNRRGYATQMQCPQCGYVAYCPHCSVSLTYHRCEQLLKCHICGYETRAMKLCPECQDPQIRYSGVGTERVEDTLCKLFPQARVARMDSDTLKRKNDYRRILDDFRNGKIDILLGTQMIAKGLHFPRVTLVGIINADISLHRPDFRAGERTFQLITQVAGRAGRGNEEGEVIVQTFTPWAPAILYAQHHDYENFYAEELISRRELQYPPIDRIALLTLRGREEALVEKTACDLRTNMKGYLAELPGLIIKGPAPAPLEKVGDFFRYHIMIQTQRMLPLSDRLFQLQSEFKIPEGIRLSIDIDPLNLS